MSTVNMVPTIIVGSSGNRAILPSDYARGAYQGTAPANVVCCSTSSVNIATLAAGSTMDGFVLSAGDLVLLKDQTASNQNGIYIIGATAGTTQIDPISSQRFTERNIQFINVFRGAVNAQTLWGNSTITTTFNGTVFSTPLSFYPVNTGGGGGGGVSSVSVVNANGLTGSVANPTTTPAITLGTSLSGIIKGTGTGFATAVAADFPTLNQNTTGTAALATNISGGTTNSIPFQSAANTTGFIAAGNGVLAAVSSGVPAFTTAPTILGTNISSIPNSATTATNLSTASTIMARDANSNVRVNSITEGAAAVTAAGGTTVLTAASAPSQVVSGALGQDFTLPDATTLAVNQLYAFSNFATGSLTIKSFLGTTIITVPPQFIGYVSCAVNSTPNGTWAGYSVPTQSALTFSNFTGVATSAQMPIATTGALGGVKPDGTTVTITADGTISAVGGGGGGAVSSVSVVSANGFSGSVANATTTPAITLGTTLTGMLKGNGSAMSVATAGTDYSAGTAALATGILKSATTTGELSIAVAGDFPTLNQNTTGTAALATSLAGGLNGQMPFQVGANTTAFSNAATPSQVFVSSVTGVPQWSSTVASANLPIATTGALGGVKPDGTTITISGSGVISAVGGASSTQKFSIPGGAIPKVAGGAGGGANSLVWGTAPNPVIDVFNFTNNSNWGMALGNVEGITPTTNISLSMNANVLASQSLAASQNFQLAYAIYGIANGTLVPVASGSTNTATLPVGGSCNLTFTSTAAPVGFNCTQLVISFNATIAGATQNNYGIPCFDYTLTLS